MAAPKKIYRVKTPDGRVVRVEGPADATQSEIIAQARRLANSADDKQRDTLLGKIDAGFRGAASGITLGWDDELAGAADAVLPIGRLFGADVKSIWDPGTSFKEAMDFNVAQQRRVNRADERVNPKIRATTEVGGSVAGVVGTGGVGRLAVQGAGRAAPRAAAATERVLARPVVGGATLGATTGAISGAGHSEGSERAKGAATGALAGGALGGVIGGTVAGLGPVVRRHWNAVRGKNATPEALRQIQAALEREGYDVTSAEGVKALEKELSVFAGKPVSLADIGASPRARTGVALRSQHGEQQRGIDVLLQRHAGQGERLSRDITDTVAPRTDVFALDDALVAQRDQTALPLRQQALNTPVDQNAPVSPDEMRRWIDRPEVRAWLTEGGEQPNALVRPMTQPRVPEDPVIQRLANLPAAQAARREAAAQANLERQILEAEGLDTSHLPEFPEGDAPLDMKALDYLKRYMDGVIDRGFRSTDSAAKARAAQLVQLRNSLRERMRNAVPEYGQYLDTYSDISSMREAIDQGRDFLRLPPEVIAASQEARDASSQELFRVGAARALDDAVRSTKDSASPANRIMHTPQSRAQLEAAGVPAEDVARLSDSASQERQLELLNAQLRGSDTDARLAARRDAEGTSQSIIPVGVGHPANWLGLLARRVLGAANLSHNAKVNEQLLPRMLEQDPAAIQQIIRELQANGEKQLADKLKRQATYKYGAAAMGAAIGSPIGFEEDY